MGRVQSINDVPPIFSCPTARRRTSNFAYTKLSVIKEGGCSVLPPPLVDMCWLKKNQSQRKNGRNQQFLGLPNLDLRF
jgi:hypothetical protein